MSYASQHMRLIIIIKNGLILATYALACLSFSTYAATPIFEIQALKSSSEPSPSFKKKINLNAALSNTMVGDQLVFPLTQSDVKTLTVTRKQSLANGDITLFASDSDGNHLTLTLGRAAVFGSLNGANLNQSITYEPKSGQYVIDLTSPEIEQIDLGDDGKIPPSFKKQSRPSVPAQELRKQSEATTAVSEITLLAIYSPEFASGFGSAISRINQMIAFTNSSFARSGILIELKLAKAEQLVFPNDSDNLTLLNQVTNGEGAFSGVEQLRNAAGADMVTVLRFTPGFSGSGIAWVNGDNDNFAYSINQFSPVGFDSVFAHEIGHNLGSGHERASVNSVSSAPCNFNLTGYSCGHGNSANGWGTIMSRLNSGAVNHVFSNPAQTCLGEPCGIPQGQTNAADNTTSFNFARIAVSNFRDTPNQASATPATLLILLSDD